MPEVRAHITITSPHGLHARPAMTLVDTANGFSSRIQLVKKGQAVDAKSIMQLMMLAATCGTKLEIIAEGEDAAEAVAALEALNANNFDEA